MPLSLERERKLKKIKKNGDYNCFSWLSKIGKKYLERSVFVRLSLGFGEMKRKINTPACINTYEYDTHTHRESVCVCVEARGTPLYKSVAEVKMPRQ